MNNASKILISTIALGVASAGQATPITGSLTFTGEVEAPNAEKISEADELTFNNMAANQGTGYFDGVNSQAVQYNDLEFDPFTGPVTPLWQGLNYGGNDFEYDLESINSVDRDQTSVALSIGADGILKTTNAGSDLDDTVWSWDLSANQAAPDNVTFSVAQNAEVPAPMSVALLGLGLVGFATAGRRGRKTA